MMLESFRNASQTWFIKILFAFLILSFGVWGVGDVIRQRVESSPAITVGDHEFTGPEVAERFRRETQRMSAMFGGKLTPEQALQFGLLQTTVQRLVDGSLLDQGAENLRLGVDDETLRRSIAEIPAFQNQLKIFDKLTYQRVLASSNISERQFVRQEREELARRQLIDLITAGVTTPVGLAAPLYRYLGEKRVAEFVTFAADKMPNPPAPDSAALRKYYDDHKTQFQQPELRGMTALVVHAADLAATIQPSETDIEKAYQARLGEFQTTEKRSVQQILFADQAEAQAFLDQLGGKDFMSAAKQSGHEATDLGMLGRADMPIPELADAAFGDSKTGPIGPLQSTLGWHVLNIAKIMPGNTRPLAEVKSEIVAAIVKDETVNRLYSLSTKLEDSIGGGNDINETAKTIGVKPVTLDAVDDHGRDGEGKPILSPAVIPPVLATMFQTTQGGTSEVLALPDNDGYYVLHVDKVTPATVRPFEAAQPQVLAAWQNEQRIAAATKMAQDAALKVKQGTPLSALPGALHVETTRPFPRNGGNQVPPLLVSEMFAQTSVGAVVVVNSGPDSMVARLKEIQATDAEGAAFESARTQMNQGLADDLLQQYVAALRKQINPKVNMAVINEQFGK
jgi:peptidyl-prolyl cis-trans isomerase D